MSFTRFNYDESRTKKQLEESTFSGRYMLNTPGPGSNLPFMEDSHIRLQKWGANAHMEGANIESDLKGLTRSYNRDHIDFNDYKKYNVVSQPLSYSKQESFVEESRLSHPAWETLDKELNNWEFPLADPQKHISSQEQISSSRLITKDEYKDTKYNFEPLLPSSKQDKCSELSGYNHRDCLFETSK